MANTREILNRMHSIQDTMKITNAMYMISSTKLRRAKKNLEETMPYFFTLRAMISEIVGHMPEMENEYFDMRKKKAPGERTKGYIVVTADKGLAGAYNHNVLKLAQGQMGAGGRCRLFVVGEAGRQFFAARGVHVAEQFHYTAQNPTLHRARIISELILEQFRSGKLDEVYLIYTSMKNGIQTEAEMMRLLPLMKEDYPAKEHGKKGTFKEELEMLPSPESVINNIIPDSVMGYVYSALVESLCSEQNARMLAMEAANRNAGEMIRDLSIQYNRVRQAMITREITEVIAGAKSVRKR